MPEIVWYTGPGHHAPPEDVRDAAFVHHTRLYDSYLPLSCTSQLPPEQAYQCIIPRLAYRFYTVPLFVIEALTEA